MSTGAGLEDSINKDQTSQSAVVLDTERVRLALTLLAKAGIHYADAARQANRYAIRPTWHKHTSRKTHTHTQTR